MKNLIIIRKIIEPVEITTNGQIIINLGANALNDDWLSSLRLKNNAKTGNVKAKKEFKKRDDTKMIKIINKI